MTKKDLERRNNFLLLQLKIINEIVTTADQNNAFYVMGRMEAITDPATIRSKLRFIEETDSQYNFYTKDMDIENYK